ncbi:chemotaxis protein [Hydrocarboniclastica marina]|uniref:Chemotaxis protein n=1 Tax=Hydrocarboniclastica marina TaxID=2259620 RepID=A0A4P7XGP3_9ALTE|nr:chemotaxis protein [Hydrocarboniclastica marina]QCF26181.1 chemotaxis protein [Hydrocarboniclastica marina]
MVQSSIATKSQSFDLVKGEIENTIREAEQGLERFQENRESGEDLQNCVDFLNQLRGIFILVELRGGTLLCQEAVGLANEIPVGAANDKNHLLTALSNALFTLRRYIEYYQRERADHPELLLPSINELREAGRQKPYADSYFFEADPERRPDFCAVYQFKALEPATAEEFRIHARRFRLMYQIGLLCLLRDRNLIVGKKLIGRAAIGMARLSNGAPMGQVWCLVATVLQAMIDRDIGAEKPRKRLLMRLERYIKETAVVGRNALEKAAPDSLYRDLVYILFRSGSANPEVRQVLDAYGIAPAELSEQQLLMRRRRLYGPGADVLKPLSEALLEEINQLKDKLDIIERGIDPDAGELGAIAGSLDRLSNTLLILDLTKLSTIAAQESVKLKQWSKDKHIPNETELYSVADAVLGIEDAAKLMVSHGITMDSDRLAKTDPKDEVSLYVREALIVVTDEARAALTLAKRAITAFLESDFDRMHLANLPGTLRSIWGGLFMLEDHEAAEVLARVAQSIESELLAREGSPSTAVLEALADALTSLEYYIEGLGNEGDRNPDLLKLAQSSLQEIGL